jgi:TetR/AcrR family transcriptional repressor of nem operon
MGRPAAFDRDAVLDAAMHAFWLNGFEATSIQDLVDATGLNRGSLYNEFEDKAGLFKAVVKRYAEISPTRVLVEAAATAPPRETIENFFAAIVRRARDDKENKGCLITNTAAELCARDKHIGEWVGGMIKRTEDALTELVRRGQKDGSITHDKPARTLARFLLSGIEGIIVLSKTGMNARALRDVADVTLSALD